MESFVRLFQEAPALSRFMNPATPLNGRDKRFLANKLDILVHQFFTPAANFRLSANSILLSANSVNLQLSLYLELRGCKPVQLICSMFVGDNSSEESSSKQFHAKNNRIIHEKQNRRDSTKSNEHRVELVV